MKISELPSPNFDSREGHAVDMLVLHYTGMKTAQEALDRMCDPAAKVSAHYMVDEDGTIYQLVKEDCRAWHAGLKQLAREHQHQPALHRHRDPKSRP
jgi:N-acetylmuramoyl-L-alanine amidase